MIAPNLLLVLQTMLTICLAVSVRSMILRTVRGGGSLVMYIVGILQVIVMLLVNSYITAI